MGKRLLMIRETGTRFLGALCGADRMHSVSAMAYESAQKGKPALRKFLDWAFQDKLHCYNSYWKSKALRDTARQFDRKVETDV